MSTQREAMVDCIARSRFERWGYSEHLWPQIRLDLTEAIEADLDALAAAGLLPVGVPGPKAAVDHDAAKRIQEAAEAAIRPYFDEMLVLMGRLTRDLFVGSDSLMWVMPDATPWNEAATSGVRPRASVFGVEMVCADVFSPMLAVRVGSVAPSRLSFGGGAE